MIRLSWQIRTANQNNSHPHSSQQIWRGSIAAQPLSLYKKHKTTSAFEIQNVDDIDDCIQDNVNPRGSQPPEFQCQGTRVGWSRRLDDQ